MSWRDEFDRQWKSFRAAAEGEIGARRNIDEAAVNEIVRRHLNTWRDPAHPNGQWRERLLREHPEVAARFTKALDELYVQLPVRKRAWWRRQPPPDIPGHVEYILSCQGMGLEYDLKEADAPPSWFRLRQAAESGEGPASACHLLAKPALLGAQSWHRVSALYEESHESASICACDDCGQLYLYCWVEVRDDNWGFAAPITQEEAGDLRTAARHDPYIARTLMNGRRRWVWPPGEGYGPPNHEPHWDNRHDLALEDGGRGF